MHGSGSHAHRRGPRVVVRYTLPVPDPVSGARLTDVVGQLVDAGEESVVVDSTRGRVTIPRDAVVATRVIPPRPSRRGAPHRALSVEDLERVMVGAWPAPEQEQLGDWLLRAGGGFTARANSALVVGHPDRPVPAALDLVEQWYATRGLAPTLAVPVVPGGRLEDDEVARTALRSGWVAGEPVLVLTGATGQVRAAADRPAPAGIEVEITTHVTDAWFAAYARSRTVSSRDAVTSVLEGSPLQWFALARSEASSLVGVGRMAISDGWAGVGAMWVEPQARGRAVGTAMLRDLLDQAVRHGCVSVHLQVESANEAAIGLYSTLGLTEHHTYAYLTRR